MTEPSAPTTLSRRGFLSTSAKLGAVVMAAPYISRAAAAGPATVNVALLGCGEQGRVLLDSLLKIPGVRIKAVCDIWPYNRTRSERLAKKFDHDAKPFESYQDMLSAVPDLDAVVVATPDIFHAEHANACMKAGKHVYCEKLMANTVENARSMVRTQRETKKFLQIGHQRRSNPRYQHALGKVVKEGRILGRITNTSGQWNRSVSDDLTFPAGQGLSEAVLNKYGYANMHEFRNWRWFKKYSGGPISDLGAHQIDIFNWFLGTTPLSVMASGGTDYYKTHEWYDNVLAIYEFATPFGNVRSFYQVLTTTSAGGGYHEYFMGDEGALKISENPKYTKLYREARAPEWDQWVAKGWLLRPGEGEEGASAPAKPWDKPDKPKFSMAPPRASVVDVRETAALSAWNLGVGLDKAPHRPHLENFFDTIHGKAQLNCPAETAFASTVTVLRVNEAVAAHTQLTFKPEEFIA